MPPPRPLAAAALLLVVAHAVVLNPEPAKSQRVPLDMHQHDRSLTRTCGGHLAATALAECAACGLASPSAPRLYIEETSEGSGSRIQSMIYGMALAAMHGMNLGGVVALTDASGCLHPDVTHGTDIMTTMSAIFGIGNADDLFIEKMSHVGETYDSVDAFANAYVNKSAGAPKSNVIVTDQLIATSLDHWARNPDHYPIAYFLNPVFLSHLRYGARRILHGETVFDPKRPSVAVHIRRADVYHGNRLTTDEWNLKMIDEVVTRLPRADVHIFSSLDVNWKNSSFDMYRERGYTVHLDDLDVLGPWTNFAQADVLITAKSSFSMVPALLNDKCVLYQTWWLRPLPGWIVAPDGNVPETKAKPYQLDGNSSQALDDCLRRIRSARKTKTARAPDDEDAPPPDRMATVSQIMEVQKQGRVELDQRLAAKEQARLDLLERQRQTQIAKEEYEAKLKQQAIARAKAKEEYEAKLKQQAIERALAKEAHEAKLKQQAIERELRAEALAKEQEEKAKIKAAMDKKKAEELAERQAMFQRLKEEREEQEKKRKEAAAAAAVIQEELAAKNKARIDAEAARALKSKQEPATAGEQKKAATKGEDAAKALKAKQEAVKAGGDEKKTTALAPRALGAKQETVRGQADNNEVEDADAPKEGRKRRRHWWR